MYRVTRRFNCRKTGRRFEAGDTYTGDRAEELIRKGRVVAEPTEREEDECELEPSTDESP